jgi:hypothetical protein
MVDQSSRGARAVGAVLVVSALVACKHSESARKDFPCEVEEVSVESGPPLEVFVEVPKGNVVTVKTVGTAGTGSCVNAAGEVRIPVTPTTSGIELEYQDPSTGKYFRKTILKSEYD